MPSPTKKEKISRLPDDIPEDLKEIAVSKDVELKDPDDNQTRVAAALQMRIHGAPFSKIAETLEYRSAIQARRAVEYALAHIEGDETKVEQIRSLLSARLDRLTLSLSKRAANPKDPDHLAYARTLLAVIDRHAKLHGADAPQRIDVTYSPSAQQIEQWVGSVAKAKHGEVVEADIIDVEVEDGD